MSKNLLKSAVLWGISKGFSLPQAPVDRVNELSFFRELLAQLKVDCVLDVGANRGQFAHELRAIGYSGRIVSFEPISSEFATLKASFDGDANWTGHQIALGSRDESMTITIPTRTVMSSLLEQTQVEPNTRTETVQVKRLDGLLPGLVRAAGISHVFLKMDTQGFDLEVFKGTAGCLDLIYGIQSELSIQPLYKRMPHYLEALGTYEAAGFELYNLSVVNRISNHGLLELNCFMRRTEQNG